MWRSTNQSRAVAVYRCSPNVPGNLWSMISAGGVRPALKSYHRKGLLNNWEKIDIPGTSTKLVRIGDHRQTDCFSPAVNRKTLPERRTGISPPCEAPSLVPHFVLSCKQKEKDSQRIGAGSNSAGTCHRSGSQVMVCQQQKDRHWRVASSAVRAQSTREPPTVLARGETCRDRSPATTYRGRRVVDRSRRSSRT